MEDLSTWTPRMRPEQKTLEGRYVRLEPLNAAAHGDALFAASNTSDGSERFKWLFEEPPMSREAFQTWLEKVEASVDPMFFVVIDKASGRIGGRQTFMRIDQAHGVVEI